MGTLITVALAALTIGGYEFGLYRGEKRRLAQQQSALNVARDLEARALDAEERAAAWEATARRWLAAAMESERAALGHRPLVDYARRRIHADLNVAGVDAP